MKRFIQTLLPLAVFTMVSVVAFAQPGLPTAPDQAPIDGGLSILAIAGGAYAVSKLRKKSK